MDVDFPESLRTIATALAAEGKKHNLHLRERFQNDWEEIGVSRLRGVSDEHMLFFQSISESLSWLQDAGEGRHELLGAYLRILVSGKVDGTPDDNLRRWIEDQLGNVLKRGGGPEAEKKAPKRLSAVTAGLETWVRAVLPDVREGQQLNLEQVQRSAMEVNKSIRWSSLAAVKMYAIQYDGDLDNKKIVLNRSIYPPMGRAVSRGIEKLLGFSLGESKNDHEISKDLHLKFADLTGESVFDLNSGFYKFGGGS